MPKTVMFEFLVSPIERQRLEARSIAERRSVAEIVRHCMNASRKFLVRDVKALQLQRLEQFTTEQQRVQGPSIKVRCHEADKARWERAADRLGVSAGALGRLALLLKETP